MFSTLVRRVRHEKAKLLNAFPQLQNRDLYEVALEIYKPDDPIHQLKMLYTLFNVGKVILEYDFNLITERDLVLNKCKLLVIGWTDNSMDIIKTWWIGVESEDFHVVEAHLVLTYAKQGIPFILKETSLDSILEDLDETLIQLICIELLTKGFDL